MSINGVRKTIAYYLTMPAVRLLVKTSLTPNMLTWLGFFLSVAAAVLIAFGHQLIAGLVVLLGGYLDIIDGALARFTAQTTRFGGVLDSTLDRMSEAVILLGIMALFLFGNEPSLFALISKEWAILLVGVSLPSFLLVSYIRARAETEGIECEVGVFTRAERVLMLTLGLLINQIIIILAIIVLLSLVTVVQRLVRAQKGSGNG